MKPKNAFAAATCLLLSLGLASCGGSGGTSSENPLSSSSVSTPETILVETLSLRLDQAEVEAGTSVTATVEVSPATASNPTYRLMANPAENVQINGNVIETLLPGIVEITAKSTDGNAEAKATLTIKERRNRVDDKTFLNDMHKDPYAANQYPSSEGWGLSDAGVVGVDKESFAEERYPVPTENVTVYQASDYGIEEGGTNNSGKLSNLLSEVGKLDGIKVIRFAKGTYEMGNPVAASQIKDVYLVGEEGTKFVYAGWMTYFQFTQCENIHLNSLTFDINPSPTITGEVVKAEEDSANGYVYVKPHEEYDLSHPEYSKYHLRSTGSYAEYYFDEEYGSYVPDRSGNLFYNPGLSNMEYDSTTNLLKCTLSKSFGACRYTAPKAGTIVGIGFQVYEHHGFYFRECVNTYMEDIEVYVVPGMGLRVDNGKNIYLNRVRYMREPGTRRLLTCTADILHACNIEGDAVFSNCILEGSHDDAVNVKSFYTTISSIRGKRVSVSQTQSEVTIRFDVGDKVDIYDPKGMKYKDTFTVLEVQQNGTSFDLTLDKDVPSRGSNSYLGFSLGNATKAVHLTLENTIIRNKRNRGVLLQGRDSVVRNCTFENVNMGALQVLGVDDVFKEAIVPQNIQILNNKFLKCWDDVSIFTWDASGTATPGTLKNVKVQNNYFYHGVGNSVWLKGAGDIDVSHNLFHETAAKTHSARVEYVDGVTLRDNATYFDETVAGYNFASLRSETHDVIQENNSVKGVIA